MEKKYVVGLGEALWDVLPEGKKLGGAPANFAFHAGQFGLNSIAVSALGEDSSLTRPCSSSRRRACSIACRACLIQPAPCR